MRRLALLLFALAGASCQDPVHDDRVAALGPEMNGVRPGPRHRPGQPCTTCHGGKGPATPEFIVAGTVYATRDGTDPAPGVDVIVTSANGQTKTLQTNDVGNFYLPATQWDATFPMHVKLSYGGVTKEMVTRIGWESSCAFCHQSPGDAAHMPHVFLRDK